VRGDNVRSRKPYVRAREAPVEKHLTSSAFTERCRSESTRKLRRSLLTNFCRAHGDKQIAQLDRKYIERLLQAMPTLVVQRTLLLALRRSWNLRSRSS
jgi:hypothetical protein